MTASGLQDPAYAQALRDCHMSWSPTFGCLIKHSERRPHTGYHQQEVVGASLLPVPLLQTTGNRQRFPPDESDNIRYLSSSEARHAQQDVGHKATGQHLIAFIARYLQTYADASCISRPESQTGSFSSMGRHSRDRVRDVSTSSRGSRQRQRSIIDLARLPQQLHCSICKDRFSDQAGLRHHEKTHRIRSRREHHCREPACGMVFAYPKDLTRHIQSVHRQAGRLACPHCSKSFGPGRPDNLNRHIRDKHPQEGGPNSRKSSSFGEAQEAVKFAAAQEGFDSYVEIVTSSDPQAVNRDHSCSGRNELMHIDEATPSGLEECSVTLCNSESLQQCGNQAENTTEQTHDQDERFRFQELSAVIRELNERVEHMLNSTELPKARSPGASDIRVRIRGTQISPSEVDGNSGCDEVDQAEPLECQYEDGKLRSYTGSPSSKPASSTPSKATTGPASSAQSTPLSSRKRRAGSDLPEDGHGSEGDRNGGFKPNGVRQMLETGKVKERHTCIFAVGEPSTHQGVVPKFDYMSQLLRHLRGHDFFACLGCVAKLPDQASLDRHNNLHHVNTCAKKSCKRQRLAESQPMQECSHLTTPQEQWKALYQLQYPQAGMSVQPVLPPDDLDNIDISTSLPDMFNMDFDFGLAMDNLGEHVPQSLTTALSESYLSQPMAYPSGSSFGHPPASISGVSASGESRRPLLERIGHIDQVRYENQVQQFQQKVQLLEQRLSQPTERERDLEMVLANVWQALLRSGSSETQTESAVWRLVHRFARNVLSTAAKVETAQGVDTHSTALTAQGSTAGDTNWQRVGLSKASQGPSMSTFSDSGVYFAGSQ